MRITYDPKYDILYLKLGNAEKVLCKDIDEDITIDIDAHRRSRTCHPACSTLCTVVSSPL